MSATRQRGCILVVTAMLSLRAAVASQAMTNLVDAAAARARSAADYSITATKSVVPPAYATGVWSR